MLNQTNPPTFKIVDPGSSSVSSAIDPIFQLNRALPDVSQLPPMPTVAPIVHGWMPDLSAWLVHLLPSFHVGAWLAGLAPLLAGIGPTIAGIVAIQIARLTFGFVASRTPQPRQRADAEYARFSASANSGITTHLRLNGISVYSESTDEHMTTFSVARYHLGALRRIADASGIQLRSVR